MYLNLGGGSLITADFQCRNPYFSFQNKITIGNIRPSVIEGAVLNCKKLPAAGELETFTIFA